MKQFIGSEAGDSPEDMPPQWGYRQPRGGGRRLRSGVIVAIAISALLGTAAVAQAVETSGHVGTVATSPAGKTTLSATPHNMGNGNLSYGTWQGHAIVLPAAVAPPPGSRLTSVIVGKGVIAFYCVNAAFVETEPLISLFTRDGRTLGLHYLGPNSVVPLSWGSSLDGSRADMAVVKTMANPATAPRVLLRAVTTAGGPATTFGGTTSIVRLPITGGAPPAARCTPAQRGTSPLLTFYLVFKGGSTTS